MPLRILVVDDSAVMRKIVCRTLAQAGFVISEVLEAADGAEALAKFRPGQVDLVLSDWHMPNMDGLEFVRRLRELEAGASHVPVVVVTTEGNQPKAEEAAKEGVDGYITKPFTPETVKQQLAPLVLCA